MPSDFKSYSDAERENENTGESSRQPSEHAKPTPQMLGTGQARRAAEGLRGRNARNNAALEAARGALTGSRKKGG